MKGASLKFQIDIFGISSSRAFEKKTLLLILFWWNPILSNFAGPFPLNEASWQLKNNIFGISLLRAFQNCDFLPLWLGGGVYRSLTFNYNLQYVFMLLYIFWSKPIFLFLYIHNERVYKNIYGTLKIQYIFF